MGIVFVLGASYMFSTPAPHITEAHADTIWYPARPTDRPTKAQKRHETTRDETRRDEMTEKRRWEGMVVVVNNGDEYGCG